MSVFCGIFAGSIPAPATLKFKGKSMKRPLSFYFITYLGCTGFVLICYSITISTIYNYRKITHILISVVKEVIYVIPLIYNGLKECMLSLYTTYAADVNSILKGMFCLGIIFIIAAALVLFCSEDNA